MDRIAAFVRRWISVLRTVAALILVLAAGWLAWGPQSNPAVSAVAPINTLPGAARWNHGVSSLLFGTNDTYEWSDHNIQNQPAIQAALRSAGFTLVRTFIPDKADDATIEQRIATIEHIGAHCLAVLTNIRNTSFNEHVVHYLGDRCLLYEFGNEPDLAGITTGDYLDAWNATIPHLRQINPAARFIGPVTSGDEGVGDYLQHFLEGVKISGVLPDAISFHYYPCYNDDESSCLAKASSYQSVAIDVRGRVKAILGRELPVGISEWNYDPGNPPPAYGEKADFITRFSKAAIASMVAGGVAFACQFDAASYSGYGRLDMFNVEDGQAKPQYYAIAAAIKQYAPAQPPGVSAAPTTSPSSSALLSADANPICSTNDSGPGEPGALIDGKFGNWGFWQLAPDAMPGWCALHLHSGAANVAFAWYSDYSFDYADPTGLAPQDYDIAVSRDSTNGSDGNWQTVASVRGNRTRAREHRFGFTGMSWIRMTVRAGQPQASQPYMRIDEFEVFDARKLGNDTFFFSGDSVTGMAFNRYTENLPSFADDMMRCAPHRYPLMIDGGFGGQSSESAVREIATWQATLPDMHYWLLGWGTNDALNDESSEVFRAHLQSVVNAILREGDVPILAHVPYATAAGHPHLDTAIQRLNRVIDEVTAANHLLSGPDLYTLVRDHPEYLGPDGLHPSGPGAVAINAAWYQALHAQLGLNGAQCK